MCPYFAEGYPKVVTGPEAGEWLEDIANQPGAHPNGLIPGQIEILENSDCTLWVEVVVKDFSPGGVSGVKVDFKTPSGTEYGGGSNLGPQIWVDTDPVYTDEYITWDDPDFTDLHLQYTPHAPGYLANDYQYEHEKLVMVVGLDYFLSTGATDVRLTVHDVHQNWRRSENLLTLAQEAFKVKALFFNDSENYEWDNCDTPNIQDTFRVECDGYVMPRGSYRDIDLCAVVQVPYAGTGGYIPETIEVTVAAPGDGPEHDQVNVLLYEDGTVSSEQYWEKALECKFPGLIITDCDYIYRRTGAPYYPIRLRETEPVYQDEPVAEGIPYLWMQQDDGINDYTVAIGCEPEINDHTARFGPAAFTFGELRGIFGPGWQGLVYDGNPIQAIRCDGSLEHQDNFMKNVLRLGQEYVVANATNSDSEAMLPVKSEADIMIISSHGRYRFFSGRWISYMSYFPTTDNDLNDDLTYIGQTWIPDFPWTDNGIDGIGRIMPNSFTNTAFDVKWIASSSCYLLYAGPERLWGTNLNIRPYQHWFNDCINSTAIDAICGSSRGSALKHTPQMWHYFATFLRDGTENPPDTSWVDLNHWDGGVASSNIAVMAWMEAAYKDLIINTQNHAITASAITSTQGTNPSVERWVIQQNPTPTASSPYSIIQNSTSSP